MQTVEPETSTQEIDEEFLIELDISHLETEDDEPVDNTFAERQHQLLTDALYASAWKPKKSDTFFALANVGLFYSIHEPPLVPDVLLSIGVKPPTGNVLEKHKRAYFVWEYGKVPDVVVEIVSNMKGNELGSKLERYAFLNIPYYVVYDPAEHYGTPSLRVFATPYQGYSPAQPDVLAEIGLGLTLWEGEYQGIWDTWLRWTDEHGALLETGEERAKHEYERAQQEHTRAQQEHARAECLAAKLRTLGINPDEV